MVMRSVYACFVLAILRLYKTQLMRDQKVEGNCILSRKDSQADCKHLVNLDHPKLKANLLYLIVDSSNFEISSSFGRFSYLTKLQIANSNVTIERIVETSEYLNEIRIEDSDIDLFSLTLFLRKRNSQRKGMTISLKRITKCLNIAFIKNDYLSIDKIIIDQRNHCLQVPTELDVSFVESFLKMGTMFIDQDSYTCERICQERWWIAAVFNIPINGTKLFMCPYINGTYGLAPQCQSKKRCEDMSHYGLQEGSVRCSHLKHISEVFINVLIPISNVKTFYMINCSMPTNIFEMFYNLTEYHSIDSRMYAVYHGNCWRGSKLKNIALIRTYVHLDLLFEYLTYSCRVGPVQILIDHMDGLFTLSFIQYVPAKSIIVIRHCDKSLKSVHLNSQSLDKLHKTNVRIQLDECDCENFAWLKDLGTSAFLDVECGSIDIEGSKVLKLTEACEGKNIFKNKSATSWILYIAFALLSIGLLALVLKLCVNRCKKIRTYNRQSTMGSIEDTSLLNIYRLNTPNA